MFLVENLLEKGPSEVFFRRNINVEEEPLIISIEIFLQTRTISYITVTSINIVTFAHFIFVHRNVCSL